MLLEGSAIGLTTLLLGAEAVFVVVITRAFDSHPLATVLSSVLSIS